MRSRLSPTVFALACCLGAAMGAAPNQAVPAADSAQVPAATTTSPVSTSGTAPTIMQLAQTAPKGSLKNPYNPEQTEIVNQGHELFMSYSCSGCHGGTGGGGMCPQINGEVWFWGIDDDVLFRLIALGSVDLGKQGYEHLGGPGLQMPPFGGIIKSTDELWKILTWIRSVYKGDPKKKTW
jgi:mono/diheme cytochrome c family protein